MNSSNELLCKKKTAHLWMDGVTSPHLFFSQNMSMVSAWREDRTRNPWLGKMLSIMQHMWNRTKQKSIIHVPATVKGWGSPGEPPVWPRPPGFSPVPRGPVGGRDPRPRTSWSRTGRLWPDPVHALIPAVVPGSGGPYRGQAPHLLGTNEEYNSVNWTHLLH